MLADQEAKRARDAEASAKQAATTAKQETARAKAAETRADEQARRATEANELAQARLARSNYSLAFAAFRNNRTSRGYELLESVPERYRNFEWHYDYNHFRQSKLVLRPRKGPVKRLAIRPDGKLFCAIGNSFLYMFDTETGAKIKLEEMRRDRATEAHWSPDGKLFCVVRPDAIAFHDGATLKFIKAIEIEADRFIWAPDSESFYTYRYATVFRWSYETGEKIWTAKNPLTWGRSISVPAKGNHVAVGRGNAEMHIYDSTDESGEIEHQFKTYKSAKWLAYSPDGSMLAIPMGRDTIKVNLVDPNSGEKIKELDTGNQFVTRAKFSPDGTKLLTAGDSARVVLWDIATGELIRSFSEHQYPISGICWNVDGKSFISCDIAGYIRVTDLEPSDDDAILQQNLSSLGVCVRDSDGAIAAIDGFEVVIRNAEGEKLRSFKGGNLNYAQRLALSPDGRVLAVSRIDGVVGLWDMDSGKLIRELYKHKRSARGLAFTPDGTKLVTGGGDGRAIVWDVATGKLIWSLEGHEAGVHGVACSPDGNLIATSSWDKLLFLWDAKTGEQVQQARFGDSSSQRWNAKRFKSVEFSPDSRQIIAGTEAGLIYYFDCETGLETERFFGNSTSIRTITFSPDGSRLVTGSIDQTIRIWDPQTHEELRVLTGHTRLGRLAAIMTTSKPIQ